MKKLIKLSIVAFTLSISNVNAQYFGIKGGVNFSNMSLKNVNEKEFTTKKGEKFLLGYNIGLTAGIDFVENFGIEAGLTIGTRGKVLQSIEKEIPANLLTKTLKINGNYDLVKKKQMLYLDIPVLAKGMVKVAPKVKVFGKFGPYIGIGLTGKEKSEIKKDGELIAETADLIKLLNFKEEINDVKWGNGSTQTKQLDYGLQMGLGVNAGGFTFEGFYKFSIGDIDNKSKTITKHHVLGLSIGYNLAF